MEKPRLAGWPFGAFYGIKCWITLTPVFRAFSKLLPQKTRTATTKKINSSIYIDEFLSHGVADDYNVIFLDTPVSMTNNHTNGGII